MKLSKSSTFWMLTVLLLLVIIAVSSTLVWSRYGGNQPVEISQSQTLELPGGIHIGGAVNNPGFYPLAASDSLQSIIQAAGGTTSNADLNRLELYVPETGEEPQPQKVDINRAEAWLLEALPGIGETRAQAIIDYRRQNGPFQNVNELVKVEGIGITTYEQIKELITVAD